MEKLSERLQAVMKKKSLTKKKFYTSLNISNVALDNILNKGTNPNMTFFVSMAEKYSDINIDWLITGRGNMEATKNSNPYLLDDLAQPSFDYDQKITLEKSWKITQKLMTEMTKLQNEFELYKRKAYEIENLVKQKYS